MHKSVKRRFLKPSALLILLLSLTSCSANSLIVSEAKTGLIGLSELDLETCLGLPDQKVTTGKTTIFTYNAASTRNLSLSVPIVNGVGLSFSGYCHATFRMDDGHVTSIRYSGAAGDLSPNETPCAPIVRSCIESPGGVTLRR